MIVTVREITRFNGKLYVREGLESDVAELQATKINAVGASDKNKKFHSGDIFKCINGTQAEYVFEEGSNQWYLQA